MLPSVGCARSKHRYITVPQDRKVIHWVLDCWWIAAGDAQSTGYQPSLVKDSQTCIEVCSEYNRSMLQQAEKCSTQSDGTFAVPEDSDIFTPLAVSRQRSAASTVSALVNLDSMSSKQKQLQGYESINSFSSSRKPVPCDRSCISIGEPAKGWICCVCWMKLVRNAKMIKIRGQWKDPTFANSLKESWHCHSKRERSSRKIVRCWSSLWKQRLGTRKIRIRFVWESTSARIWKEGITSGKVVLKLFHPSQEELVYIDYPRIPVSEMHLGKFPDL